MDRFERRHAGRLHGGLVALALVLTAGSAPAQSVDPAATFARVNGVEISVGQYAEALRQRARQTFYHGAPPEGQLAAFHQEVADALVQRVVLQQEGISRGLCEGPAERAVNDPDAAGACRAKLRAAVAEELPPPTEADLQAYHREHPDKFTEPARVRLSVTLIKVPPSSAPAKWQETVDLLARLREEIIAGDRSFEDTAREFSDDESAARGGDMGYLHGGMLGESVQKAADTLAVGEISEPITLLEGVAIFQLNGRQEAVFHPLDQVRERAVDLLQQEREESAWNELVEQRRRVAEVEMNTEYLSPRGPDDASGAAGGTSGG